MALLRITKQKTAIYILFAVLSLIAIYIRDVQKAGYKQDNFLYTNTQQGAPQSTYDLPVHIVTWEPTQSSTQYRNQQSQSAWSISIPSANTCVSEADLCDKIRFIGNFSDADKRKYQSLIIKQINNIDALLSTDVKIRDVLYSITLDSSRWTRRWRAGSSTVMLYLGNINGTDEFTEILTHELGHIVDLSILKWTRRVVQNMFYNIDHTFFLINDPSIDFYQVSRLDNQTRADHASAMGFVGWYAMTDPFEDFAESFNMYLNHHNVFALLAGTNSEMRKKYLFMQRLFDRKYLKADTSTAYHMKDNTETRPRDTTKWY